MHSRGSYCIEEAARSAEQIKEGTLGRHEPPRFARQTEHPPCRYKYKRRVQKRQTIHGSWRPGLPSLGEQGPEDRALKQTCNNDDRWIAGGWR